MLRFDEKQLSRLEASDAGNPSASDQNFQEASDGEDEEDLASDGEDAEDLAVDSILESNENIENNGNFEVLESKEQLVRRKDWKRVRKHYKRSKQYIFVAATLPINGKKTAGGVLKQLFPDACWFNGNYVHRHNPRSVVPGSCYCRFIVVYCFLST